MPHSPQNVNTATARGRNFQTDTGVCYKDSGIYIRATAFPRLDKFDSFILILTVPVTAVWRRYDKGDDTLYENAQKHGTPSTVKWYQGFTTIHPADAFFVCFFFYCYCYSTARDEREHTNWEQSTA